VVVEAGMKDAPRARGNMTEMAIYYYCYIFYMAIFDDTHLGHLGHVSHLFRPMVRQIVK
jgi:hypothetical protein